MVRCLPYENRTQMERRVSARRGWAGEINSLFEQPEVILVWHRNGGCRPYCGIDESFRSLLDAIVPATIFDGRFVV